MFDREGRIAYASAECGRWLGIDPEQLVGRSGRSAAGVWQGAGTADGISTGPSPSELDRLAAAMAPPAGVGRGQIAVQTVRPPAASAELARPAPRSVLFVPLLPALLTGEASEADASTVASLQAIASSPAGTRLLEVESVAAVVAIADLSLPPAPSVETAEARLLIDEVHRQLAAAPDRGASLMTLGSSVAAARLNRQIEAAAATFSPVTLVGPAGNPVEGIVRRIHAHSPRPAAEADGGAEPGPLVPVAGPLMDAELFDATTGSLADRLLQDDQAHAALLVHDIDQLPRDAQQRLELLVHNHPRRLRVFATTTRSAAAISDSLLPSIAALIGTFELNLPALADRIEDVPLLAAALLDRRRVAGETRAEQLGRDALDRLVLYPWPGNFLELEEAIRTAARGCRGETIRVEHLPLAIRSYGATEPAGGALEKPRPKAMPLDQALERYERELIGRALEQTRGNRAAAARLLQISRPRLLRRIEQLQLEDPARDVSAEEGPGR